MGALLERIAGPATLADSWKRVLANDAEDDVLSAGVRRFAQDANNRLNELLPSPSGLRQSLVIVAGWCGDSPNVSFRVRDGRHRGWLGRV